MILIRMLSDSVLFCHQRTNCQENGIWGQWRRKISDVINLELLKRLSFETVAPSLVLKTQDQQDLCQVFCIVMLPYNRGQEILKTFLLLARKKKWDMYAPYDCMGEVSEQVIMMPSLICFLNSAGVKMKELKVLCNDLCSSIDYRSQ